MLTLAVVFRGLPEDEPAPSEWAEVSPRALVYTPPPDTKDGATASGDEPASRDPDIDQRGQQTLDLMGEPSTTTTSTTTESGSEAPPPPPATSTETTAPVDPGGASGEIASAFASSINGLRTGSGLTPLTRDGGLDAEATAWAERLAAKGELIHSDLSRFFPQWTAVAENLAAGSSTQGIFTSLSGSAPHLSNMLGDYAYMGVGAWVDGGGVIWTVHLFAR